MDKILLLIFFYVKPNIKSAMGWEVLASVGPAPYIGHVSQSIKKGSLEDNVPAPSRSSEASHAV